MPKLSVIIPAYNSGKYIRETLLSIMAEDYQDYEIIVVDDASTDNTGAEVSSLRSDRIHYIKLSYNHGGPSRARNIGINIARGEYIAFFDSDDLMVPGRLKTAVSTLESFPDIGMAFTNAVTFDDKTGEENPNDFLKFHHRFKSLKTCPLSEGIFFIGKTKAYNCLFFENFILMCGITVRRNIFDSVGLFDESLTNGDDRDMCLRIAQKFNLGFIDEVLFKYRMRPGSISGRGGKLLPSRIRVWQKRLESPIDEQSRTRTLLIIADYSATLGYLCRCDNQMQSARKYYLVSMRAKPDWRVFLQWLITFSGPNGIAFMRKLKWKITGNKERKENIATPIRKDKIGILYIIDTFSSVGGTEKHLSHLLLNLPATGFSLSVAAFDLRPNILLDLLRNNGITVVHIPVGREYTLNALKGALKLSRFIRANNIDIVQTYHQKSDTFGALVAKWSGVKHIISSKRDMGQYRKIWHVKLNRALRNMFEKTIVVADAVGKMIVSKEGVSPSRIVRIYNGVDTAVFHPPTPGQKTSARECLGFGTKDFVIGMVANFREEKNHDIFFEGALQAMKNIPSLKIVAVGDGPLLDQFRAKYGSGPIMFPGAVSDVLKYLHAMDVACLIPGKNEGFSNSILEKMAAGLPLIVTDVGGNAEAVIDRENGFVIRPYDSGGFANALVALHDDLQMRLRMGLKSRELAEQKFSLASMCRKHEALYLSIAGKGRQYSNG
jgi:glycosyltransferase involved in cell wall biosynthesis